MTTIRDVANKAEVSIATVSHVVNGSRPVYPEIREHVLKAVEEFDYRPNFLARAPPAQHEHDWPVELIERSSCRVLLLPDNIMDVEISSASSH